MFHALMMTCVDIDTVEMNPEHVVATPAPPKRQDRFAVPADISEWASKDLLQEWLMEEIGSLNWNHPELLAHLRKNPSCHPRELFCLLTYAYATGLFESEEIVSQSIREPALRRLLRDYSPSVKEIRRFRKENRGLLRWALTQVMKRAIRERYDLGNMVPAGIRRRLEEDATERLVIARHMDGPA